MAEASTPVSLRLSAATRDKLDKAAAITRRSRSFLMQEALERHLDEIVRADARGGGRSLQTLLSLGGAGHRAAAPRTEDEVRAYTRRLRGDA
ncbi:MAG TPA: ribbon-helix-helix domain-containing protein [Beijerinckiaceae bacterium]|jgi:hypothetical protein